MRCLLCPGDLHPRSILPEHLSPVRPKMRLPPLRSLLDVQPEKIQSGERKTEARMRRTFRIHSRFSYFL